MGRLIDADALYRRVKAECNPYGKPSIGWEDGQRIMQWIEQAPTVDGWISVEDRLPDVSGYVLTCARIARRIDTLFYSTDYKAFNAKYTAETATPVTHWMPLPEPPNN